MKDLRDLKDFDDTRGKTYATNKLQDGTCAAPAKSHRASGRISTRLRTPPYHTCMHKSKCTREASARSPRLCFAPRAALLRPRTSCVLSLDARAGPEETEHGEDRCKRDAGCAAPRAGQTGQI